MSTGTIETEQRHQTGQLIDVSGSREIVIPESRVVSNPHLIASCPTIDGRTDFEALTKKVGSIVEDIYSAKNFINLVVKSKNFYSEAEWLGYTQTNFVNRDPSIYQVTPHMDMHGLKTTLASIPNIIVDYMIRHMKYMDHAHDRFTLEFNVDSPFVRDEDGRAKLKESLVWHTSR